MTKDYAATASCWLAFRVVMMTLAAGTVCGQDYPNRPIRIVASAPGGASDFASRLIAQGLTASLGHQVVMDNRAGSVIIPAGIVAKAAPDGHTLLIYSSGLWTLPLFQSVPYDPVKDFSPITGSVSAPNLIVVHPSLPVKSVRELIELAKAKPGDLNYASAGTGSTNHLAAELFKSMAKVDVVRIQYKGVGPALIGLLAGEVQLMFPTPGAVIPHVKSGRLRALAVGSAQPSALLPELPTVTATGLPGFESSVKTGIFAPAKTPAAIIKRLNGEIVKVLNQADVKGKLFDVGVDVVGSSPEEFASVLKSEIDRMRKIIKDAGIRAD